MELIIVSVHALLCVWRCVLVADQNVVVMSIVCLCDAALVHCALDCPAHTPFDFTHSPPRYTPWRALGFEFGRADDVQAQHRTFLRVVACAVLGHASCVDFSIPARLPPFHGIF